MSERALDGLLVVDLSSGLGGAYCSKLLADLGARVVAEGVETMEACSIVEDLGCDYVQGFLLGRPAPEEMVGDLLRRPGRLTPDDWPTRDEISAWESQFSRLAAAAS